MEQTDLIQRVLRFEAVPVFPLDTVVLPGGFLPLNIFEPRYLQMVERCRREETGFVLAPTPQVPLVLGTLVEIVQHRAADNGTVKILAQGRVRVRLSDFALREGGLDVATSQLIPPPAGDWPIRPDQLHLVRVLEEILRQVEPLYPYREAPLGDAQWVGWRLLELLPFDTAERLRLMLEDDAHALLAAIEAALQHWVQRE